MPIRSSITTRLVVLISLCGLLMGSPLFAQDNAEVMAQLAEQREFLSQYAGDSVNTATIYNNIGVMFHMLQRYDSAEYYHMQSLEIKKQLYDAQNPEYQQSIDNLLALYIATEQYEKLMSFCNQAGDTLNTNYATALHFLAADDNKNARYADATDKMHRVIAIREQVQGTNHPDYALSLNLLALLEQQQEHYQQAEKLYNETLRIQKEVIGKRHKDYISTLNNLSTLYYMQGNFAAAEPLMREALNFRKREYGQWSAEYASSLNQMAALYHALGDYPASVKVATQSMEIVEHEQGKESEEYVRAISNLGEIYRTMGEYAKAEPLLRESCNRCRAILGNGHPNYALSLNNLASFYVSIDDNESAKPLLQEVLWIKKQTVGTENADYALALRNMATLYTAMDDYAEAEQLLIEAIEIGKKIYGINHPDYANSLAILATLYDRMGRYDEVEPLLTEVLNIRKNTLGEYHPDYAMAMNNMSVLCSEREDFEGAEKWQRKALAIYQRNQKRAVHGYAQVLYNLATICLMRDKMDEAEAYYRTVFELNQQEAQKMFCFMSERQRDLYWARNSMPAEMSYPTLVYKYRAQKPEIATFAYDNELYLKGLLLNTTVQVQNVIANSGDSALIRDFIHLKAVKEQIIHLQQQSTPAQSQLDSLSALAERLDKQLVKGSQAYQKSQQAMRVDWQQVRNSLREHEVAIEFSSFWMNVNGTVEKHDVALILRNKNSFPFYVDLGREEDMAAHLTQSPGDTYDDENGGALYNQIWRPIVPFLLPQDTIYFAPAGLLHQLNLAALPVDEEKVFGEQYALRRISSTRELALRQTDADQHRTFRSGILFGGIDYGEGGVPYLPGTLQEVRTIQSQLQQAQVPTVSYIAKQASEDAFKAINAKDCDLLHIATHGFFYPNEKLSQQAFFSKQWQLVGEGSESGVTMDPMMRAGLMLANANQSWTGGNIALAQDQQDGILTAKEVALVDLSSTQLVVLSACETGRGEVTSEGVFGLQRAFKQAGANSIIMSLWKVNDRATALMMTSFYEHLMAGQSPHNAFQLARDEVRAEYPDPYFWAAFIMID